MKTYLTGAFSFVALLTPFVAFAQGTTGGLDPLIDLVSDFGDIVDLLVPIAVTLAVVFFFWGLAKFILSAGDDEARKNGRQMMLWGVIAIFLIVAIWGIVEFLARLIGVNTAADIDTGEADRTFFQGQAQG